MSSKSWTKLWLGLLGVKRGQRVLAFERVNTHCELYSIHLIQFEAVCVVVSHFACLITIDSEKRTVAKYATTFGLANLKVLTIPMRRRLNDECFRK